MGFRLIREHSREYKEKIDLLKSQQLFAEAERWRHLTTHSLEEERLFLAQFQDARRRVAQNPCMTNLVERIARQIVTKRINIATIQGNLEIGRLKELLDDAPLSQPPSSSDSPPIAAKLKISS